MQLTDIDQRKEFVAKHMQAVNLEVGVYIVTTDNPIKGGNLSEEERRELEDLRAYKARLNGKQKPEDEEEDAGVAH
ncbi:hypothetical protein EON65_58615 [archaeon]|nr:MAG: hypothetical protein EON65_58615 [archaeon]